MIDTDYCVNYVCFHPPKNWYNLHSLTRRLFVLKPDPVTSKDHLAIALGGAYNTARAVIRLGVLCGGLLVHHYRAPASEVFATEASKFIDMQRDNYNVMLTGQGGAIEAGLLGPRWKAASRHLVHSQSWGS